MAQQPPSLEDILSQVSALQGQLTALQQVNLNLQNQLNASDYKKIFFNRANLFGGAILVFPPI